MAKIDRVEQLPEWFRLDRYRDTETFDAAQWYEQLSFRMQILEGNPEYPIKLTLSGEERDQAMRFWRNKTAPALAQIRSRPTGPLISQRAMIVRGKSTAAFIEYRGGLTKIPISPEDSPVRPLAVSSLLTQARFDHLQHDRDSNEQSDLEQWSMLARCCDPSYETPQNLKNLPLKIGGEPVLSIDLRARDDDLRKAFDAWLKRARADRPLARNNRKPAYKDWARYGLLPLLDLLIWELEAGVHIPDRVMSAAVSHYDKGESSFRKTVKPLAVSLMCSLSELRAQAIAEAEDGAHPKTDPETFES